MLGPMHRRYPTALRHLREAGRHDTGHAGPGGGCRGSGRWILVVLGTTFLHRPGARALLSRSQPSAQPQWHGAALKQDAGYFPFRADTLSKENF